MEGGMCEKSFNLSSPNYMVTTFYLPTLLLCPVAASFKHTLLLHSQLQTTPQVFLFLQYVKFQILGNYKQHHCCCDCKPLFHDGPYQPHRQFTCCYMQYFLVHSSFLYSLALTSRLLLFLFIIYFTIIVAFFIFLQKTPWERAEKSSLILFYQASFK